DIRVTGLRTVPATGAARVAATVNGEELFFESRDIAPSPAPELFASALLPVAAGDGARLVIDAPLDPVWRHNVETVLRVWSAWWGPAADPIRMLAAPLDPHRPPNPGRAPGVGLCFT